jgi:urocanate hydratase
MIDAWTKAGEAKSVGLLGNAADVFPELDESAVRAPTSSPTRPAPMIRCNGYLPQGWTVAEWRAKRESDPKAVEKAARAR